MNLGFDLDYPTVQEGGSAPACMEIQHPGTRSQQQQQQQPSSSSGQQQPFQYLITEQAKSLLVLQHEVGALLEFRDVVMDTFPNLRQRLVTSTTPSTWEPGVKVKRKIVPKDGSSGNGVQDSGFSTETNSSSAKNTELSEAEEELWTLLDIIHTKGTRLQAELKELGKICDNAKYTKVLRRRARSLDSISQPDDPELDLHGVEILLDRLLRCERDNALANARVLELEQRLHGDVFSGVGAGDVNSVKYVTKPNRRKLEDILRQKDYLELQRRLILAMVENQGLTARLESTQRARTKLTQQLEATRDEIDDLRFRLEEKSIQLEGTRARLRCLERLKPSTSPDAPQQQQPDPLRRIGLTDSELARAREIFDAPSVLPVLALPMPNSLDNSTGKKSPTRRKPSRIPRKSPVEQKTTTIHMSYKKVSTPTPTSSSTPSLRPSGQFSTVRSRDTLSRRSHSESARSLQRSRGDSLVVGSTPPTPTSSKTPNQPADTDKFINMKSRVPRRTTPSKNGIQLTPRNPIPSRKGLSNVPKSVRKLTWTSPLSPGDC